MHENATLVVEQRRRIVSCELQLLPILLADDRGFFGRQPVWNKWSSKLYLGGKVQREHFDKNIALRISPFLMARLLFPTQTRFAKAGKIARFFLCRFKNGGWLR
jgi:hypothetical protein